MTVCAGLVTSVHVRVHGAPPRQWRRETGHGPTGLHGSPGSNQSARARVSDVVRTRAPEVTPSAGATCSRRLAGNRHDPVTHVSRSRRVRAARGLAGLGTRAAGRRFRARGSSVRGAPGRGGVAGPRRPSVVIATGTASGKSLAYQLPVALDAARPTAGQPRSTCPPTKALAADQLRSLGRWCCRTSAPRPSTATPSRRERDWARAHSRLVLRTRTCCTAESCRRTRGGRRSCGGCSTSWSTSATPTAESSARTSRTCCADCAGSARSYGAYPTFVLASATVAEPGRLRRPADRAARRGGHRGRFAPRFDGVRALGAAADRGARRARSAGAARGRRAEAADLLADLVVEGVRALAFVRSRRGAEVLALTTRRHLAEVAPELADRVAAYRAGYLPEERRALEAALRRDAARRRRDQRARTGDRHRRSGRGRCSPASPARWRRCGSRPAGRAGRAGALAVFVARDDPLDTYLVHHPDAVFGRPVEATVLDPENPYVLGPQLCCAAAELALTEDDLPLFGGAAARAVLPTSSARGLLRHRPTGWYWTARGPPATSTSGAPVASRAGGRGGHRPGARHRRRVGGPLHGPPGRGLPPPRRRVRRRRAGTRPTR